jgi:hypothetical protein
MLNAAFAEVAVCGVNRVINAVLFVVIDADESGDFSDDGWRCMGWGAHGTAILANSDLPRKCSWNP